MFEFSGKKIEINEKGEYVELIEKNEKWGGIMKYKNKGYNRLLAGDLYSWDSYMFDNTLFEEKNQKFAII